MRRLLLDSTGQLWIGTAHGLSRHDGQAFKNWTKKDGLADNNILALAETKDGRLWVATNAGLDCFDAGRFTKAVQDVRIVDLFVDREENVWIARGGLLRLDSSRPEVLRSRWGVPVRSRYDLIQAREGALWSATENGLVHYSNGINKTYSTDHGLVNDHVRCLLEDSHGGIWIGTEGGVNHFDGMQFTSMTVQDGLSSPQVTALVEDSAGRIWMGTTAGITIYDPGRTIEQTGGHEGGAGAAPGTETWTGHFSHLTTAHGLQSDTVTALLCDADGAVWIGTVNGVCRWHENSMKTFELRNPARCFLQDDKNELWAGNYKGLFHFDGSHWKHVTVCGDSPVVGLAQDGAGRIWLATQGGLKVYDGFAAQTLTTTDGIPDFWCGGVICDQRDDGLYFISGMKVARYRPGVSPPPVKIIGVSTDKEHPTVSDVRFISSQQFLEFAFHGTSFKTRSEEMLYRYRLRGYEDEWKLTDTARASYGRLPPGDYTFEVAAIDRDLSHSETPASVKVTVDRDYRQAALWLFLGGAMIAIVLLGMTVVKRNRGIRQLNVHLDQRVRIRTAELESEVAENRKLHKQLLQTQKLDAVGTMASGIAHDFNNSLAAIMGFAELARSNSSNSDEYIDHILTASQQAAGTTRNLLTFSQESTEERRPRDIIRLVRDVSDFLQKMLPTSIKLTNAFPENATIWCSVDIVRIQQLLLNVTMNARDALPDGGEISISAAEHDTRPDFVQLAITDNGTGMPEEVQQRIFDPFFTTKSRGQGTGLGMAIVHGIVEDHDGTVDIESTPGKGTTISIVLPRCRPVEVKSVPPKPIIKGRGETILVAEDNPDVRTMIESQLRSAGFEVLTASDGQEALSVLRKYAAKIRLVLLDIDLPGKDGLACLREITLQFPQLPAIMMSGLSSIDPTQLATPFLRKPFERTKLLATINAALPTGTAERASGILVVDDNEIVRKTTKALLVSSNFDVYVAANGAEAVAQLTDNRDRIGTVLLDWNMPQTDPVATLQELLRVSPTVRVLVVSGDLSLHSHEIRAKGFAQLLRKPYTGTDLVEAVA